MEFKGLAKLLFLVIFLMSCKSSGKLVSGKKQVKNIRQLSSQLEKSQTDYQTFKARAKIKLETTELAHSASLYLRIKKDSIVWGAVTALLGLEILRFYATQDEIWVINKMEAVAYKYTYREIDSLTGISDVSLKFIEHLFVGNMLYNPDEGFSLRKEDEVYILEKSDQLLLRQIFINSLMKIYRYNFVHQSEDKRASVLYTGQINDEERSVPEKILIKANIPELNSVEISYQSINFDKSLHFNTSIPNHYEIIE